MAEGRRRDEWDRASSIMAIIANANRDPKKPPASPRRFHPFYAEPRGPKLRVSEMRSFFVDKLGFEVRKQTKKESRS